MFTKYTDINLPKNYSGSRFKQELTDTKMKTHRAQDISTGKSVIKSAMSPTFQDIIDKTVQESEEEKLDQSTVNEQVEEAYADSIEESTDTEQEVQDSFEEIYESNNELTTVAPTHNSKSEADFFSLFKESGLGKLLSSAGRDDFLLIGLIALLASDGSGDNLDAIILLALLLLYS